MYHLSDGLLDYDVDFFFLFAGLIAYGATGFASGLTAGLTFAATGRMVFTKCFFEKRVNMFHRNLRF